MKVRVEERVVDAAGIDYWGTRIVFRFKTGQRSVKGYAVDLPLAEKMIIEALCLASYFECLAEAEKSGAECRTTYRDCLYNPEAFKHHAELLYQSFQKHLEKRGGA